MIVFKKKKKNLTPLKQKSSSNAKQRLIRKLWRCMWIIHVNT